jgi:hypothetical protein
MWVFGKMVPKCELFKHIPLYVQELYCKKNVYELKKPWWGKGIKLKLATKAWAYKKYSFYKFS